MALERRSCSKQLDSKHLRLSCPLIHDTCPSRCSSDEMGPRAHAGRTCLGVESTRPSFGCSRALGSCTPAHRTGRGVRSAGRRPVGLGVVGMGVVGMGRRRLTATVLLALRPRPPLDASMDGRMVARRALRWVGLRCLMPCELRGARGAADVMCIAAYTDTKQYRVDG